jgi:coenzyme Q-binding protein COQ10
MTSAIRRTWVMRLAGVTPATAFAVLSDVQNYPKFLPGFEEARVLERHADAWLVENVLAIGAFKFRFRSRATFEPLKTLTVVSVDGPWRRLRLHWNIRDERGTCAIACEAELDFKARPLAMLARFALPEVERRLNAAFAARMREMQAGSHAPPDLGAAPTG